MTDKDKDKGKNDKKPVESKEAPASTAPAPATAGPAKAEDLLFLVVDDDANVRRTVIEYLISFGFTEIREATNGMDALKILQNEKVDFVISDWEMPNMTGIELLTELRTDDRTKDIPFIMVTSQESRERQKVEKAVASKVNAYILKPFRVQTLREKIDTLLAHTLAKKSIGNRKGVLLVDDDPNVRETVTEYLTEMGYDPIHIAKDGEEGFQLLKKHAGEIAFVLSDWEMPKLAGIDLLKKIRSDKELHTTPFIMITSASSIERVKLQNAIESDVDHYLLKPFKVSDLKDKIDSTLKKAELAIEIQKELERAKKAAKDNRPGEAEKIYDRILKMDRTNIDAYLGMAALQIVKAPQKGVDKAIQFIRAAIKINPAYEKSYLELALLFERALSLEKAIAILQEGLNECPLSENIHFHLGRLMLMRGLREKGIAQLKKALELKPDMKEAEELLGSWATR